MTREIELTHGMVALVDDEDFALINEFEWHAEKRGRTWYAIRRPRVNGKKQSILMHRQILSLGHEGIVDHADMNGLNNQRDNLRSCSKSQNSMNRIAHSDNTTGLKGVGWHKQSGKWRARIKIDGQEVSLGLHDTAEAAALAYNAAAVEFFGEFARLNGCKGKVQHDQRTLASHRRLAARHHPPGGCTCHTR